MGVDDMQEAIEKGYLGGKYTVPKTIKFTDEMLDAISAESEATGKEMSEWIREVIAEALLVIDAQFERRARARSKSKCTSNTLVNHEKGSSVGADKPCIQNALEGNER